MSWSLVFTDQYEKRALRFLKRHPDLEKQYLKTLQLLEVNRQSVSPLITPAPAVRSPFRFAFSFHQPLLSYHS